MVKHVTKLRLRHLSVSVNENKIIIYFPAINDFWEIKSNGVSTNLILGRSISPYTSYRGHVCVCSEVWGHIH